MTDREKVMRDLAHIAVWVRSRADMATPGSDAAMLLYSWEKSCDDALALLREQEAVEPIGGYGYYICGVCKNPLNSASQKFCSECGRKVKYDD